MNQDELAAVERIFEEDPYSLVFARLASAYLEQGDIEKASALCLQGIEAHPLYVNGYLVLAKCRMAEGAAEEARSALKRVLRLDPDNMPALWELAQMNAAEGRTTLAARNLTRILGLEPLNDAVRDELARLTERAEPLAAEEAEPSVPEDVLPEQPLVRAAAKETEAVGVLSPTDGEQAPSSSDEEGILESRGSGWELLDPVQEGLAEEKELAPVDEAAGFLQQDQPFSIGGPEDVEDEQTTRSDLSELLFAGDEESADQEEERTDQEKDVGLDLPDRSPVSEADREDVLQVSDEQDTELAQLLQSIERESDTPLSEEEKGEDLEGERSPVQSALDEILSSLESEFGVEESSELVADETEGLSAELPEKSEEATFAPPEPAPSSEEGSERRAISTSESEELLRILGEISEQKETEPHDTETTEDRSDDPIVTVTLAEIYANQGLVEKALQILEEASKQRPEDLRIRNRLKEIKDRAADADGSQTDPSTEEE